MSECTSLPMLLLVATLVGLIFSYMSDSYPIEQRTYNCTTTKCELEFESGTRTVVFHCMLESIVVASCDGPTTHRRNAPCTDTGGINAFNIRPVVVVPAGPQARQEPHQPEDYKTLFYSATIQATLLKANGGVEPFIIEYQ